MLAVSVWDTRLQAYTSSQFRKLSVSVKDTRLQAYTSSLSSVCCLCQRRILGFKHTNERRNEGRVVEPMTIPYDL